MAMKSPPGSISPPAECRDQLQIGPRTRIFGDGASGSSFWKIMAASTFFRVEGNLWASEGHEVRSHGQGRAPPAGPP